jgi:hypothetical protein
MRLVRMAFAIAAGLVVATGLSSCGGGGGGGGGGHSSGIVTFHTTTLPVPTTGIAYAATFDATFPHPPGVFLKTGGALPTGLVLDKNTGVLSGFPRQTGLFSFEIAARDGADESPTGGQLPPGRDANFGESRRTFTLNVQLGPPNIIPQQPPAAQYRGSYGYQIDVAGGTAPYVFAQTGGTLPNGLTVDSSGFIGNFPTQAQQNPYEFQVTVTDANNLTDTDTLSIQVVILPLIILTSDPIPAAAINFPYDLTLTLASPGGGVPFTWSQVAPGAGETDLATIGMEISAQGHLQNKAPAVGPTGAPGTYAFTVQVTDEASQVATRTLHITLNPGPVLTQISPNKAAIPGPYTVTGANFQVGAKLLFKPGATQVVVTPNFVNATTLTFANAPAAPAGSTGFIDVRVVNPDGGFFTKTNAFAFPASNISFSATPSFPTPQSSLSSTGLDVGDCGSPAGAPDGFADIVHCGTNTFWNNASGNAPGVDVLINNPPGGTFNAASPAFNRIQLATSGDWYQAKFVDANSDGLLDVAAVGNVGSGNIVRVWLNNGLGTPNGPYNPAVFSTSNLNLSGVASQHVSDLSFGRLSGPDAIPDFAYVYQENTVSSFTGSAFVYSTGSVASMKGNGSGAFSALDSRTSVSNFAGGMAGVTLGKFDSDVQSDTAITNQTAGLFLPQTAMIFYSSSGTGLFGSSLPLTRPGQSNGQYTEELGAAAGDVTGDGHDDFVLTAGNNSWGGLPGLLSYQVSTGGAFTAQSTTNPGTVPLYRYVAIADLDFDVALDMAVTASQNRIDFYKGRAAGPQFMSTVTLSSVSPRFGRIAAGDFNKDGRPDVCAAMSFFAEARNGGNYNGGISDRGNGSPQGVVIFLNTSN